ncbi:MAG: PilZ domain-containing protein [Lachnospiraceae bacterium]|nr:PilZ domain-containing protein [Lachnospiraceae bacterium]
MEERRRSERHPLESSIVIKRLDGTNPEEVAIEITDVSKTGIGFTCSEALQIGAVYESFLKIWTQETIHAFVEIVRIEKIADKTFSYGCMFIGMPEMDNSRIMVYETVQHMTGGDK